MKEEATIQHNINKDKRQNPIKIVQIVGNFLDSLKVEIESEMTGPNKPTNRITIKSRKMLMNFCVRFASILSRWWLICCYFNIQFE